MKSRRPGSVEDALTIICGLIGFDEAARMVGRSAQHVRRWTDPDNDHLPNIHQALQMDAACLRATGEAPLIASMNRWMRAVAKHAKPKQPDPISDVLMDVTARLGLLAGEVRTALADGALSNNERDRLLRHLHDLREEAHAMERSVQHVSEMVS